MEQKIRQQRQQVFTQGFCCMMSKNCSDLITQKTCETCPINICEQELNEYEKVKIKIEYEHYITTEINTSPQYNGYK